MAYKTFLFRKNLHYRTGLILLLVAFAVAVLLLEFQVQDLHDERDQLIREAMVGRYPHQLRQEEGPSLTWDEAAPPSQGPVVIYNRVPKTGSTSFTGLAYALCEQNHFNVLHICTVANTHVLSVQDQIGMVRNISTWTARHPAFFHGHFAYIDFARYGSHLNPLYINMVRTPLDRFISYYYFLRHGDDFRPSLTRHKARRSNETLDECVLRKGFDCSPDRMWIQIPFFCGHNPECWKPGSKWAYEQAKFNMVNHYYLVGVTEYMEEFVAILEASLPQFFNGALDLFVTGEKSHLRKTKQKIDPSPYTLDILKSSEQWVLEDKFYRFVLETFKIISSRSLIRQDDGHLQFVGRQFSYEKIRPRTS